jgi:hypothetical protein
VGLISVVCLRLNLNIFRFVIAKKRNKGAHQKNVLKTFKNLKFEWLINELEEKQTLFNEVNSIKHKLLHFPQN